jgi:hypothetical protein
MLKTLKLFTCRSACRCFVFVFVFIFSTKGVFHIARQVSLVGEPLSFVKTMAIPTRAGSPLVVVLLMLFSAGTCRCSAVGTRLAASSPDLSACGPPQGGTRFAPSVAFSDYPPLAPIVVLCLGSRFPRTARLVFLTRR